MGSINRSRSFFKMKVDILRPFFGAHDGDTLFSAFGSITAIAGNRIVDGAQLKITGCAGTITFEFDKDGNTFGGTTPLAITDLMTATQVRDVIIAAIQSQYSVLTITASVTSSDTISLRNDTSGTCGNHNITTNVADSGFVVSGMSGGADGILTIRDPILTDYTLDITNVSTYIEEVHSDIVMDKQIAAIEVARSVGFFAKNTDIRVNDIVRENANPYNNNTIRYWRVVGKLNYSRYDFHVRVDLDNMNYQRQA